MLIQIQRKTELWIFPLNIVSKMIKMVIQLKVMIKRLCRRLEIGNPSLLNFVFIAHKLSEVPRGFLFDCLLT